MSHDIVPGMFYIALLNHEPVKFQLQPPTAGTPGGGGVLVSSFPVPWMEGGSGVPGAERVVTPEALGLKSTIGGHFYHECCALAGQPMTKNVAYRLGLYSFPPPPVSHEHWTETSWINYIDRYGCWHQAACIQPVVPREVAVGS